MWRNKRKVERLLRTIFLVLALGLMMTAVYQYPLYASESEGFLIVTREMFVDALDEYIQWKTSTGFEVYVITAEWIQDNVEGEDLRFKIRNCIRDYYYSEDVKYTLLIGDSVNIEFDPEAEEWQEPPTPVLSEAWNLPAGYYRWDVWNTPQFTTLFYSDLSDKVHYDETEFYYAGDFRIYVGVIPVRTPNELRTILAKTMLTPYYTYPNITYVISEDVYSSEYQDRLDLIQALAGSTVSTDIFVFGNDSSLEEIHEKLFERKGVIRENGHGNHAIFKIGDTIISNEDAANFQFINTLFIADSCLVQTYHMGGTGNSDCLDEAFLKAQKGPAVILSSTPWGAKYHWEVMSDQEMGFWEDLFGGKPIGEALIDHCEGAWQNPIHLFGDPSLVVVGEPEVDIAPPDITEVSQIPPQDNVTTEDEVRINARVIDELSGVKRVGLNYTSGDGLWIVVDMTNLQGNIWNATIPSFPYDTTVTYRIIAEDNMGNTITTEDLGYEYQYTIIPEPPPKIILPPTISVVSPENKTYTVSDVPLTFTVNESTSWTGYSLDGQANTTITGNTTLAGLLDGSHNVVVYANDTTGNMGASNTVYFSVDTTPPNITEVSQTPTENNVLPEDEVIVDATVVDVTGGVERVALNYTNGNGTWVIIEMTSLSVHQNVWSAIIPAFPYGTNVTYIVIAEDDAGNTITSEKLGYDTQYQVVPEFPSFLILPLIMMATVLTGIAYRRKRFM